MRHFFLPCRPILIAPLALAALVGVRIAALRHALSLHASKSTASLPIALLALFSILLAVLKDRMIDQIGILKPIAGGGILITIGCAIPGMASDLSMFYVAYVAALLIGSSFLPVRVSTRQAVGAINLSTPMPLGVGRLAPGSRQPNVPTSRPHASPAGRPARAAGLLPGNASQVALPVAFGAAGATLELRAIFDAMDARIGPGVPIPWHKAFQE